MMSRSGRRIVPSQNYVPDYRLVSFFPSSPFLVDLEVEKLILLFR